MPPQTTSRGRRALFGGLLVAAIACCATALSAQDLPLQRDYPGMGPYRCPTQAQTDDPPDDDQRQAVQLASDAGQAVVLGDLTRARDLLARASQLNPTSADLAYRLGRVLEDLSVPDQAMIQYCRSISLGAVDIGIEDAQSRLDHLNEVVRESIPEAARAAFASGIERADAGTLDAAVESFTSAIDNSTDWAPPIYNRAVVYERLGRLAESLADYRRFLDLSPVDVDPVVQAVSERVGRLEGLVTLPTPSPAGALTIGMLFPGGGQYYSGRGISGTVFLSVAAAAVATGFMYKKVTVTCLTATSGSDCPAGDVVDESTSRPYIVPALGAAGAVMLVAAIEAFIKARGRRADAEARRDQPAQVSGLRLTGPSVAPGPHGTDVSVLSVRFR